MIRKSQKNQSKWENKINKQNKRITLKVKIKLIISNILIQENLKKKNLLIKKLIKVKKAND